MEMPEVILKSVETICECAFLTAIIVAIIVKILD